MRHHRIFVSAIVALLVGSAPAAWARHQVFSITVYGTPRPAHMNRVQVIAHELEDVASGLSREAQARAGRVSRREAFALSRLSGLEAAADRFHQQVESSYRDPRRSEGSFRSLVRAYNRAADALDNLDPSGRIYRQFDRIEALMSQLAGYYDGGNGRGYDRDDRGGGRFDHDRGYDRDHDHDRDRDYDYDRDYDREGDHDHDRDR